MARMTSSRENPPLLFGCLFICGPPSHPFYGAVSSDTSVILCDCKIHLISNYEDKCTNAIQSLDDKKTTALELTAAANKPSAAITLIPGDAGTPIADKLADLSSYFLIVVCAIYLEKYLVTITGLAAFKLLIPIGCILLYSGLPASTR